MTRYDTEADIYLGDGGMVANHISGRDPWDLLVDGARATNWVIIPAGCPTCLTQPGQMEELPKGSTKTWWSSRRVQASEQ